MAISSFGALLQQGDGGTPENFSTIYEVQDISGPSLSLDTEETTNHSSTNGWYEIVGTILHGGEVSFECNYSPTAATHDASTGLIKDMEDRTLRNFQLVFPDGSSTTWSFSAYVTEFEPDVPVNGRLGCSVTLEISGEPTLA